MIQNVSPRQLIFTVLLLSIVYLQQEARAQIGFPEEDETVELSEFIIRSTRDNSYGAATAFTATRIGVPIIQTPLNIQVVTAELMHDQAAYSFQNALRYTSGISGGSRTYEAGALNLDGNSTVRGFPPTVFLRNGFRRFMNVSTENAERIEIVKGPASVFFGQSAPGGVLNIISRKPMRTQQAELNLRYGSYDYKKTSLDIKGPISRSFAYRLYANHIDSNDWRDYMYHRQTNINPQIAWQPSKNFLVNFDHEFVESRRNWITYTPIGNKRYLDDWAAPSAAFQTMLGLTPAQIQARWLTNINQWLNDTQALTGTRPFRITNYIPHISPRGVKFNQGGADQFINRKLHSSTVEMSWRATEWLTVRYGGNYSDGEDEELRSALTLGNGDGTVNLNPAASLGSSTSAVHQVDTLLKCSLGKVVANKLVLGWQHTRSHGIGRSIGLNTGASPQGFNFWRFYDASSNAPIRLKDIPQSLNPLGIGGESITVVRSGSLSWFGEWFESKRLSTLIGIRRENDIRYRNGLDILDRSANTPTFGATFRVTEGFSVFGSYSENFSPHGNRSITGGGVLPSDNAYDLPVERGEGYDFGLKADSKAHRLSGSLSVFQVERSNIPREDSLRNLSDPRNASGMTQPGSVRWMVSGGLERVQGSELDIVWSPVENYQALVSATWMWEAKVVRNPAILPGTLDDMRQFQMGRRLRNTPEHMFAFWNKYTFSEGMLRGFSIGGGIKYSSEVEPRATDLTTLMFNPSFTTVDLLLSYTTKIANRDTTISLNAQNLLDRRYYEGNTGVSDPLKLWLSLRVRF